MDTFAFIIHPVDPQWDVSRKYPFLGRLVPERLIDFFSAYWPPVYLSEIEGVASVAAGKQIRGWFVACPFIPRRMMELPERTVYRKIVQSSVIYDVARPRDVSAMVAAARNDIFRTLARRGLCPRFYRQKPYLRGRSPLLSKVAASESPDINNRRRPGRCPWRHSLFSALFASSTLNLCGNL